MKDSFRSKHVIKCSLLFSSQKICGTCNINIVIKGIIVRQVIIYTHELTEKQHKTAHSHAYPKTINGEASHGLGDIVIFRKTKHSIYLQEHQRVQGTLNIHGRAVIQKYHVYFFFFLLQFPTLTRISFYFHSF